MQAADNSAIHPHARRISDIITNVNGTITAATTTAAAAPMRIVTHGIMIMACAANPIGTITDATGMTIQDAPDTPEDTAMEDTAMEEMVGHVIGIRKVMEVSPTMSEQKTIPI